MTRSLARLTDLVAAVPGRSTSGPAERTPRNWSPISSEHPPGPEILTPDQSLGRPDRVAGHLLHAAPDGAFSILGLVWSSARRCYS
jgi:hypothetical protein